MNTRLIQICLATIIFSTMLACKSQQAIQYKLNLPQNTSFKYSTSQESDVNVEVMGQNQKTINEQTFIMDYTVKEIASNGDTFLEAIIEHVKVNQINPMASMVYDSKEPSKNTAGSEMYDYIVGTTVMSQLNKNGELVSISGFDTMVDKMVEKMPEVPMISKDQMKESMRTQFGDESMSNMFSNIYKIYPNKAVKVGDSWSKKDTLAGTVEAIINTTYTLTSRKNGKSYIDVKGTVAPNPKSKGTEMMGMRMKYNLSGSQVGTIVIDEATGWADENEITQKLSGSVQMSGELIPTMDSKMEMQTTSRAKKL